MGVEFNKRQLGILIVKCRMNTLMNKKMFIAFCALVLLTAIAYSADQKEYLSPDGKYRAYVIPLPKALYGSGESKIVIKAKSGKTLCLKSYGSEDGEHGFGVEKAAWTFDSRFFVYSMSSSGGHQAWHFPTNFISTTDWKVPKLDDYLGPITDPGFLLSAPDTVKTVGRDKSTLDEATFEVRLRELVTREGKK
jgi:hypothetical protein